MVVFTCDACGESVKKAQVEKHVNMCRSCQCLSCMDCGKDFWGDDYKCHVKCVSEDQKYGGKGYEAKTAKGDVKQQEWIQILPQVSSLENVQKRKGIVSRFYRGKAILHGCASPPCLAKTRINDADKVHEAIQKTSNAKVRDILEQMYAYDNIPRKKGKFQNWMANSLKIHSAALQDQVWDIFSEATKKGPREPQEKPQETVGKQSATNQVTPSALEENVTEAETPAKKKSKRERKEERQNMKKTKKSKAQSQQESSEIVKSKKPKREDPMNERGPKSNYLKVTKKQRVIHVPERETNGNGLHAGEPEAKLNVKKRKRKLSEDEPPIAQKRINTEISEKNEDEDQGRFSWKGTIKAVLKQAPDNEISIKKLRKKVLAQYYAVAGDHPKSEEDIWALFNKKVNSNPKFRVLKEKVKLLK